MKFEDRSHEESERQQRCAGRERCARGDAWRLAKNIYKLKKRSILFTPAEELILPAASTIKPKEREFVEDSGASMHMVSRKDLNKAELETVRISENPTTVVTTNGDVMATNEISRDRPEVIFSFRIFAC